MENPFVGVKPIGFDKHIIPEGADDSLTELINEDTEENVTDDKPSFIGYKKLLFGRDHESRKLHNLLMADRIVLLYGPSGAGKSSLIQASFRLLLEPSLFQVISDIRFNDPSEGRENREETPYNDCEKSLIDSFLPTIETFQLDRPELASELTILQSKIKRGIHLIDFFDEFEEIISGIDDPNCKLYIFDQFEDIFNLSFDEDDIKEFFENLGQVLKKNNRFAIFSLREDFLGALEPYVKYIPNRLSSYLRLGLLKNEQAIEVLRGLSRVYGEKKEFVRPLGIGPPPSSFVEINTEWDDCALTQSAAEQIVRKRLTIKSSTPSGGTRWGKSNFVDPVLLQIVCQKIWREHEAYINESRQQEKQRRYVTQNGQVEDDPDPSRPELYRISIDRLTDSNVASEALSRHYEDTILQIVENDPRIKDTVPQNRDEEKKLETKKINLQRIIRVWFEDNLITEEEFSKQVSKGPFTDERKNKELFDILVNAYMLRVKFSYETTHYELSHQRWIKPILKSNELWRSKVDALFNAAYEWRKNDRKSAYLARGRKLLQYRREFRTGLADSAGRITSDNNVISTFIRASEIRAFLRVGALGLLGLAIGLFLWVSNTIDNRLEEEAQIQKRETVYQFYPSLFAAQASDYGSEKDYVKSIQLALLANRYINESDSNHVSKLVGHKALREALNFSVFSHRIYNRPGSAFRSVAFSPTGDTLAIAGPEQHGVHLVSYDSLGQSNAPAMEIIGASSYPDDVVRKTAFSPNGRWLAFSYSNQRTGLLDLTSDAAKDSNTVSQAIEWLNTENKEVHSVLFSDDNKWLAIGDLSRVYVYDLETSTPTALNNTVRIVTPPEDLEINAIAFDTNSNRLIVAADSVFSNRSTGAIEHIGKLFKYQLRENNAPLEQTNLRKRFDNGGINALAVKNNVLAIAQDDGTIMLRTTDTFELTDAFASNFNVFSLAFAHEKNWLALAGESGEIWIWDYRLDAPEPDFVLDGHQARVVSIAFHKEDNYLVSASWDGSIRLWDFSKTGLVPDLLKLPTDREVKAIDYHAEDSLLAIGAGDQLFIYKNKELQTELTAHQGGVQSLAFCEQGNLLASAGRDLTVRVYDTGTWNEVFSSTQNGRVYAVDFNSDCTLLASGNYEGQINVWNVDPIGSPGTQVNPALVRTIDWAKNPVFSLAFHPEPSTPILALGSEKRDILLWDLRDEEIDTLSLSWHTGAVNDLVFNPAPFSNTLLSGSSDGTVGIWNIRSFIRSRPNRRQNFARTPTVLGHFSAVRSIDLDATGEWLISVDHDGEARLWDLSSLNVGSLEFKLPTYYREQRAVQNIIRPRRGTYFSKGAEKLYTGSYRGRVFIWDTDTKDITRYACEEILYSFKNSPIDGRIANEKLLKQEIYLDASLPDSLKKRACPTIQTSRNVVDQDTVIIPGS